MELFFRTLFDGIKEGTIAAWYDTRWYICIMAIVQYATGTGYWHTGGRGKM